MNPYVEKFWQKVDKSGDCWLWTASTRGNGYGQATVALGKQGYAHRFSYEITNGPIPAGFVIDHKCHNILCVKPGHLQAVSQGENQQNQSGAHSNSSTGIRNVSWNRDRRKYQVFVRLNRKSKFYGYFDDPAEAEEVAIAIRNKVFTNNILDRKVA